MSRQVVTVFPIFMESRESCLAADGRAWKVDGRAQALVGPGLATPLLITRAETNIQLVRIFARLHKYSNT